MFTSATAKKVIENRLSYFDDLKRGVSEKRKFYYKSGDGVGARFYYNVISKGNRVFCDGYLSVEVADFETSYECTSNGGPYVFLFASNIANIDRIISEGCSFNEFSEEVASLWAAKIHALILGLPTSFEDLVSELNAGVISKYDAKKFIGWFIPERERKYRAFIQWASDAGYSLNGVPANP